jgi:hypothetical protein
MVGARAGGRTVASRRAWLVVVAAAVLAVAGALTAVPASAAQPPLSSPRILAHLDLAAHQQPENIALLPDGSPVVTFSTARQIARIDRHGGVHVLATLPAPPAGTTPPPALGAAAVTGIVRAGDGTLYVNYAAGSSSLNGVWALPRGGRLHQIAALPPGGLPNGLALDAAHRVLYATDSVPGVVWRVPLCGGRPTPWATGSAVAGTGFVGANGIKVRDGEVWVSNLDTGTLWRIPVTRGGTAGPPVTVASGLTGIDDFAFAGHGTVLAALIVPSQVALVRPDGTHSIVLTAADGLSNPTSVAVRGSAVFVPSAAYLTGADPNLLVARLHR